MAKLDLITSSTRPASPASGKAYFETDTNKVIIWDGSAWTELVSDNAPAPAGFNISTQDTEANILASSPTNPSGEVTAAYATDTERLCIYDGISWVTYDNNFTI